MTELAYVSIYVKYKNTMSKKYNKELLEPIVLKSKCWSDVCRFVNVKPSTGAQTYIKKKVIEFGIKYSHFTGRGWKKGKTFLKKDALTYCYNGSKINSHRLKNKLIRDGYKDNKCEKCGLFDWFGDELPLELDHIDGNHNNNEFENLKILCPNCHAIKTRKDRKCRSSRMVKRQQA